MKSKPYQAIVVTIAVLGIIGCIIMLISGLGWFTLAGLVSTLLLCFIFGGIYDILSYLEELGAGKAELEAKTKKLSK